MNPRARFGESLRQHRERRHLALEKIAQDTKISRSLFAGLERGDCSRWPPGVYSRAYMRSYADAIGLDSNVAVAEFAAHYPELAWPEGPPSASPSPREPTTAPLPATHLRISFANDSAESWRRARERAFIVVIETLGLFGCAALLQFSGAPFWVGLALVTLGYHAFGSILMGGSPVDWSVRLRLKGTDPILTRIVKALMRGSLLRVSKKMGSDAHEAVANR